MKHNKRLGDLGEEEAAEYLRRKRYKILETQYRAGRGEVDIIAEKGEYIVFVEVKTRADNEYGTPAEAVTLAKQRKIIDVARTFLTYHEDKTARFDIIEVIGTASGGGIRVEKINHIENAFWEG